MQYALFAMVGLLLLLVGYWLLTRRRTQGPNIKTGSTVELRRHSTPQAQLDKLRATGKFWGYRIESHCRPSSRLAGRQYAVDEIPPLPVEGCSAGPCGCRLVGIVEQREMIDRRSGQDRRRSLRMDSTDRRADRPRRECDLNSWGSYSHL